MSTDWKQDHANDCNAAVDHPLVEKAVAELLDNLGLPNQGLPRYGAFKVAHYAAMVARAQALGFNPDLLRLTPQEADSLQWDLAARAVVLGVPVHMLPDEGA